MTTLTLNQKYVDILKLFGNLEETVEIAIQTYLVEQINERIETARREILVFEKKYGMTYEAFRARIGDDDAFVEQLWDADPIWEDDLMVWEYYGKVLTDWTRRLKNVSKN
ncbi:hypothetical protein QUF58_03925 [Anaerolineales bacterium HSG24]|nr:hypothetical protein [Anaerolineales bacterium HSG24]